MILVTGATGHIGRSVVCRLAARGREVVAMVRNIDAARRRLPAKIPLRVGDYEDVGSLQTAFDGVDVLVLISSDGEADAVMRHHANAIDAAAARGVRHIVFTSILDASEMSTFYFADVYRTSEHQLAHCGVPSTVLACGLYSDFILEHWLQSGVASGELALPANHGQFAPISRDDVAAAIASVAARPEKFGDIRMLTGDRLLDFDDVCAIYREVSGRPLRYRSCAIEEYLTAASARLDEPWPRAFASLCASIGHGGYCYTVNHFAGITRRKPESFRDFLVRTLSGIPPVDLPSSILKRPR
ncbi:NAD-dependent epimerase/dehydratase family protein [Mesorhizobium sp. CU2]|uniref:NmrA family NAD(P)-binding protein n=1 Tax=unclassified Mesorhizobium TaxID=325217 RepID=UPI00112A1BB9|nr:MULTISPECIES: NmrA family NAD(P)-binding protein [unclassified Mesorhizobium]TPN79332.1 NAD-dependent epimerase/dehydratase family protein [Mesorhizobium sp. CU3]TPO11542.1 NAD-dependent epimerase/dehydratase family protein [Mesorhizobium sp. CU2]